MPAVLPGRSPPSNAIERRDTTRCPSADRWRRSRLLARCRAGRSPRKRRRRSAGACRARELLANAIRQAREGVPVSSLPVAKDRRNVGALKDVPGFAAHFLTEDGKPLEIGSPMVQPRLADTLEQIAHAGYDDFYRGDVAAEIAADLEAFGSPVTREDLRKHEARLTTPLSVDLADCTLFNTPPPTQGIASLLILGLFDRLGVKRGERLRPYPRPDRGDQARLCRPRRRSYRPAPWQRRQILLAAGWLDAEAEQIDTQARRPVGRRCRSRHVHMCAVDRDGLAVSFIQSLYWEWGSGVVLPRTGIVWQNRGISFSLDPERGQPADPRPQALPYAQSRPLPASKTAASCPMARWAATASRNSRRRSLHATPASAWSRARPSTRRAGGSGAPGAGTTPADDGGTSSIPTWWRRSSAPDTRCVHPARCLLPIPSAMPP